MPEVDVAEGWTVQSDWSPPEEANPALEPQQFLPEQLPSPDGAASAGVPEVPFPAAQVNPDAASHPNGPEPGEVLSLSQLPAEEEDAEVDLSTMTKAQIQEWADENGYEVDKDSQTKDEMIEAIVG